MKNKEYRKKIKIIEEHEHSNFSVLFITMSGVNIILMCVAFFATIVVSNPTQIKDPTIIIVFIIFSSLFIAYIYAGFFSKKEKVKEEKIVYMEELRKE